MASERIFVITRKGATPPMSLWDKLRGELVDIVEFPEDNPGDLMTRFPRYQDEIKYVEHLPCQTSSAVHALVEVSPRAASTAHAVQAESSAFSTFSDSTNEGKFTVRNHRCRLHGR